MSNNTKADSPALRKAFTDEKIFPLLSRDKTAPAVICSWIKANIKTQPAEKLHEALDLAIQMSNEYAEVNNRKTREQLQDRVFKTDVEV